ncbi:MAG: hypothetical protein AAB588_01780 [Patescibacteria group bacterium]
MFETDETTALDSPLGTSERTTWPAPLSAVTMAKFTLEGFRGVPTDPETGETRNAREVKGSQNQIVDMVSDTLSGLGFKITINIREGRITAKSQAPLDEATAHLVTATISALRINHPGLKAQSVSKSRFNFA